MIASSLTVSLRIFIVQFLLSNTVILITQSDGKEPFQSHAVFSFFNLSKSFHLLDHSYDLFNIKVLIDLNGS